MKVIFNKDELLAGLIPAAAIAPSKGNAVDGILFSTEEHEMCGITAYDLEKGFITSVPCKVMCEGKCVINAQGILQIAKSMPNGEITIDVNEKGKAKITGGGTTFEIGTTSGENYPAIPVISSQFTYPVEADRFKDVVSKSSFAVAAQNTRAVFTGVHFKIADGKLLCIGCDGGRLGLAETDVLTSQDVKVTVPGKILTEIMKAVKSEKVIISATFKHIFFKIGDMTYFSRLIDGDYINYERIIPTGFTTTATIDTQKLKSALERAAIVTEDKLTVGAFKTFVKMEFVDGLIKLSSATTGSRVYEEIPVEITGEDMEIGFNCMYILEAVKAAGTEKIKINLKGSMTGALIESADEGNFKFFVMPVRMKA